MRKGNVQRTKPATVEPPDHSDELKRLKRIKGQLSGIEKMIEDRRYCPEIINQVLASIAALESLKRQMLRRHLQHCVTSAMKSGNAKNRDAKINELLELVSRG